MSYYDIMHKSILFVEKDLDVMRLIRNREKSDNLVFTSLHSKILFGSKGDFIYIQHLYNFTALDNQTYSNEDVLIPVRYNIRNRRYLIIKEEIELIGVNE